MANNLYNLYCDCTDWKISFPQIVSAQLFAYTHGHRYTGKPFRYCPWCKKRLKEKITTEEINPGDAAKKLALDYQPCG